MHRLAEVVIKQTSIDLYRGAIGKGPNLHRIRSRDIDHSEMFKKGEETWVYAGGSQLQVRGASSFATVFKPRFGSLWRLPAFSPIPAGVGLVNDKPKHWLWIPLEDMPLEKFRALLKEASAVPPWHVVPQDRYSGLPEFNESTVKHFSGEQLLQVEALLLYRRYMIENGAADPHGLVANDIFMIEITIEDMIRDKESGFFYSGSLRKPFGNTLPLRADSNGLTRTRVAYNIPNLPKLMLIQAYSLYIEDMTKQIKHLEKEGTEDALDEAVGLANDIPMVELFIEELVNSKA